MKGFCSTCGTWRAVIVEEPFPGSTTKRAVMKCGHERVIRDGWPLIDALTDEDQLP